MKKLLLANTIRYTILALGLSLSSAQATTIGERCVDIAKLAEVVQEAHQNGVPKTKVISLMPLLPNGQPDRGLINLINRAYEVPLSQTGEEGKEFWKKDFGQHIFRKCLAGEV